ncbi:hypothetical protein ACCS44_29705 [Rhizobium ruizarguesonis]
MTVMHVLYKIRTAYEFGRDLNDDDYNTCQQSVIDLLFDFYAMKKPEVVA